MKASKLHIAWWGLFIVVLLLSCEEIGPEINPQGPVTPPNADTLFRRVLVEEFAGVRCVNCPAGATILQALQDQYGEQLIIVSIHAGTFATPYAENQYDFRTTAGNNLLNFLGQPFGYPSAVIDRALFPGEPDLQLGQNSWAGYIEQRRRLSATFELSINPILNESTGELRVDIETESFANQPGEQLRLSVMLVEDRIRDVQLTPAGRDFDYEHRHVFRDMLTAFSGSNLDVSWQIGARSNKSFFYNLPQEWEWDQLSVVAFLHREGSDQREILQARKVNLLR